MLAGEYKFLRLAMSFHLNHIPILTNIPDSFFGTEIFEYLRWVSCRTEIYSTKLDLLRTGIGLAKQGEIIVE
jgi:hypothetical protein